MLTSVKIQREQSELRSQLAVLAGKQTPDDTELRQMTELDGRYQANEQRFRAALISETEERSAAKDDLEGRSDREYADLISRFELRQVAQFYDEGRSLSGQTAEVVEEMRSKGSYRGVPVPLAALEQRSGETISSGTPDPIVTKPIIDRLFPQSVAAKMGTSLINIDTGAVEYPVVTSSVTAGWADGELADVAAAQAFATTDKPLKPEQNFGVQMVLSRKTLKQSAGIEDAVRRDMNSAIAAGLDKAIFLGTGANGQPLGVISGQATYGISTTAISAAASWSAFRAAVVAFMLANTANGASDVNLLIRPEVWSDLDDTFADSGSGITEWDRLLKNIPAGNIAMSNNALVAPAGSPLASKALLTTSAGGVAPIFAALWGGIDLVRDPYAGAAAGSLKLTAILTADVTVARPSQLAVLTGIQ
ncbi:phage major capsid protein [Nitrobacter sp. NHB1]|uniref:phage major capsid protein n=1 Tax=Nitrobacter sp. NHB1 TaxID=3119830 RepID=UPI003000459F